MKTRYSAEDKPHKLWVLFRFTTLWVVLAGLGACGADSSEVGSGGGGGATQASGESGDDFEAELSVGTDPVVRATDSDERSSLLAPPFNATACTLGSQCPTGNCVDGYCCDSKCDNKCMACSVAKKGSGVDGICGSIKYDTDPDNDCPNGACDGKNMCKNYNGAACTAAPQCLSNYCVDGFCCGNICMGACQACSAAKKGSGFDGACGSIKSATDPDNECNPGECNGSSACTAAQTPAANGTVCTSAAQCQSGYCADGVCCDSWCLGNCQACTAAKKGSGTNGTCGNIGNDKDPDEECWGGSCDGNGVCKQYNGVPCTTKTQCLSAYCVDGFCCGNICTGMCYACSEAKKGQGFDGVCGPMASGKDPENECNPGECNGSGICNQPQTPQANGTTCVSGGQCASGNCVDGYCCDTSCTSLCKACSAAKKGSGANGTCGSIATETDPDTECNGGKCDGTGACRYYNGAPCSATNQCFSNYCVDGVCCGNVCTGTCYACSSLKKGQGSDGSCGPIANTRDPDNECSPGECNGSGACNQSQIPQANGMACSLATQCVSGFCTDGVCCDKACSGTCDACTATKKGSGTNGLCGPIKYDTDPDNECYGGACSGSSTCQFYNGFACTQTAQCLSNYCVDGVCCGNICTGKCSACTAAKKGSGFDGQCGSISVGMDPDDECPGSVCDVGNVCASISCSTSNDCLTGLCSNGTCAGILQVYVNGNASCALFLDGRVKCWGNSSTTGLGDTMIRGDGPGEMGTNLPFVDLGTNRFAKKIAVGNGHVCALLHGGLVACWGNNNYGQLGRGDTATNIGTAPGTMGDNLVMVHFGSGKTAVDIAAGITHNCVVLNDATVKCWGDNDRGQLGIESMSARGLSPMDMGDNLPAVNLGTGRTATAITAGYDSTCALLDNGTMKCWGYNSNGKLGLGDNMDRGSYAGQMGDFLPVVDLGTGKTAVEISANYNHVCARLNDSSVKCWGSNNAGQLGQGDVLDRGDGPNEMGDNLPVINLGTGKTATQLAAGGDFTCAQLNDATVKCWGTNDNGESGAGFVANLGDGPGEMGDALVPVNLGTGKTVLRFTSGTGHTCLVLNDGSVKCWGYNGYGQLGLGDTVTRGNVASGMGDNLPAVQLY